MSKLLILSIFGILYSCNSQIEKEKPEIKIVRDTVREIEKFTDTVYLEKDRDNKFTNSEFYLVQRLPNWILDSNVFNEINLLDKFKFDNRLNPLYLEADFNGDGNLDVAIPIKEIDTNNTGFAIIHGITKEIYIIGAGADVKYGLGDDMSYIDIWKINREKTNKPGIGEESGNGEKGELIINNPSIEIIKSEVGGGIIYWNGTEYAYFHQTC